MSKPWDGLREKPKQPPITAGTWAAKCGAQVKLIKVNPTNMELRIASADDGGWWFDARSFRELAEFCTELADQLEGK